MESNLEAELRPDAVLLFTGSDAAWRDAYANAYGRVCSHLSVKECEDVAGNAFEGRCSLHPLVIALLDAELGPYVASCSRSSTSC
jgi:hypothetical protein